MSTALATQSEKVGTFLESRKAELAAICSKHITPERAIQLAVICTYKTPKLLECDPATLFSSVCQAASMGWDLSPAAGEAYLIPRWNKNTKSLECQLQVGFQGLAKSARASGAVRLIQARVVRAGDVFKVTYHDDAPTIIHGPKMDGELGDITHVYAVAKLATGEKQCEVMTTEEVEYIRSRSEKPDSGPWVEFWGEMAKKTVIRRLCKSLPKSVELVKAIELHDAEYDLTPAQLESSKPLKIDNGTGSGSGKYASEADTASYLLSMEKFLTEANGRWLDHWSTHCGGDIPKEIKEINRWQADGHLVKWALETGRLQPGSAPDDGRIQNRNIGRLTAIVYHRDKAHRGALARELRRYVEEQQARQMEAVKAKHPELFQGEVDDDLAANDDAMDGIASEQNGLGDEG